MKKLWWLALPLTLAGGTALANYTATQGSGTTYASVVLGGTVHYMANLLCDLTVGQTQCAAVNASGQVGVIGPVNVRDGAGNAITSDVRGSERPLSVQLLDASGNQITTFGGSGGTSSNFGTTFPPNTTGFGTAIGMKDSSSGNMVGFNGFGGALETCIWNGVACSGLNSNGAAAPGSSSPVILPILVHKATTALGTSLVQTAGPADLVSFNCTAITGGSAGFCIAYNGNAAPATGPLTGSLVLDFCYFDTTPTGCSLSHMGGSVAYSNGIVILVSSNASPYTWTTGTVTAAVSADSYQ